MGYLKIAICFIIVMILSGCNQTREINKANLDFKRWRNDPFGCKDERYDLADSILKNKKLFIGFDTIEVIKYLGKPDEYNTGGSYMYYIAPNYHCNIANIDSGAVALNIEFNCLHRVCKISKTDIW